MYEWARHECTYVRESWHMHEWARHECTYVRESWHMYEWARHDDFLHRQPDATKYMYIYTYIYKCIHILIATRTQ